MINLNELYKNINTFNLKQTKTFLKACKGNKYECLFKLMMTYNLSRIELACLEWNDIDFENDTITIYPILQERNNQIYYKWKNEKKLNLGRTFPLLPTLKTLLLDLKDTQEYYKSNIDNYDYSNEKFVCLKSNGTRLSINTLSRNLRYIARDNSLPLILLNGLSNCLNSFVCEKANNYDYYRAWTRFDCKIKHRNDYKDVDLSKNKKFVRELNNFIEQQNQRSKSDMEM